MFGSNEETIKYLQLRRLRHTFGFWTLIEDSLTQKFTLASKGKNERFSNQVGKDIDKCHWKFAQRAQLAIMMYFRAHSDHVPALHNLVKNYMDVLQGSVFSDDRQVRYLEAYCYRSKEVVAKTNAFIKVERFSVYKRKLKFYSEFKDELDLNDEMREVPYDILPLLKFEDKQWAILQSNRIENFDSPMAITEIEDKLLQTFPTIYPFGINFGNLPRVGESKEYKARIRRALINFRDTYPVLSPLKIPVELDVQVTPRTLELGKDLDNIMVDICHTFAEELFGKGGYINAFRVYVREKLDDNSISGVRVKVLPFTAIQHFNFSLDNVLEKVECYLEKRVG